MLKLTEIDETIKWLSILLECAKLIESVKTIAKTASIFLDLTSPWKLWLIARHKYQHFNCSQTLVVSTTWS